MSEKEESLVQQVALLNRKIEREKKARTAAEQKLEEYSRHLYETNLSLTQSLDVAQRQQYELELLNSLGGLVVSELDSDALLIEALPIMGDFLDASYGVALHYKHGRLMTQNEQVWCALNHWLDKSQVWQYVKNNVSATLTDFQLHDGWKNDIFACDVNDSELNYLGVGIPLSDKEISVIVFLYDSDNSAFEDAPQNVLSIAKDLLGSGLRRRSYESRIRKRNQQLQDTIANLESVQQQLIQSEKMASLGQLAAGVAHEINNPVGYISANTEILSEHIEDLQQCITHIQNEATNKPLHKDDVEDVLQQYQLDFVMPDIQDILKANREGVQRIIEIVNGLRTFSHPGGLDKQPLCLADCITKSLKLVTNELKYKHIIKNNLPDSLPKISGNSSQLQQVFVILIINATHAMPDGGTLSFSHSLSDTSITVHVKDTGIGIPEENLNQIFSPFFTTKPVGSGTGLGLSITHSILKAHNASISVESKVGDGTCFSLCFEIASKPTL